MFQTSLANISVTIELWTQVFWVILVQYDLRNTLPKSGPFLLLHPVYNFSGLKKCIKYANKCVIFQLPGYSSNFPGVFLGDCYWAHHVHKSFYCVGIPSGRWTCPVLVWSRSADWVSRWCTSVLLYHQLHRQFHCLLSLCMMVVLLLEFNSLDNVCQCNGCCYTQKKRQFRRAECKITPTFEC